MIEPLDALIESNGAATPIVALRARDLAAWRRQQPANIRQWIEMSTFRAESHTTLRLPDAHATVLLGLGSSEPDRWSFAGLPYALPQGDYRFDAGSKAQLASDAALGWTLGAYEPL